MMSLYSKRAISTVTPLVGNQGRSSAETARYARPLRYLHWIQAFCAIGAIGSVNYAMRRPKTPEGQQQRLDAMFAHKSMGTLIFLTIPIRILIRLTTRNPPNLPSPKLFIWGAHATHFGLYLGLVFMSFTGVGMAAYSGKPLPFFWTTLDVNLSAPDPEQAKYLYNIHKQFGFWWQFLVPLHLTGTTYHVLKGQKIHTRVNPFAGP